MQNSTEIIEVKSPNNVFSATLRAKGAPTRAASIHAQYSENPTMGRADDASIWARIALMAVPLSAPVGKYTPSARPAS